MNKNKRAKRTSVSLIWRIGLHIWITVYLTSYSWYFTLLFSPLKLHIMNEFNVWLQLSDVQMISFGFVCLFVINAYFYDFFITKIKHKCNYLGQLYVFFALRLFISWIFCTITFLILKGLWIEKSNVPLCLMIKRSLYYKNIQFQNSELPN